MSSAWSNISERYSLVNLIDNLIVVSVFNDKDLLKDLRDIRAELLMRSDFINLAEYELLIEKVVKDSGSIKVYDEMVKLFNIRRSEPDVDVEADSAAEI
ncbi:MAG: hypothetical protein KAR35_09240 [Candidatus Heimdallarchaeota archaeon]|nr:hypothetical protein [Candidatus Heimdallarchaeota archaeon]MCK5049539.1 hypothetical protein [Candidatus Heimdallarchaeota archaeon]